MRVEVPVETLVAQGFDGLGAGQPSSDDDDVLRAVGHAVLLAGRTG